jgi:hypothetical protein
MARVGRFGRLPRSVPSLTSTLVAIAREQQNQTDQNMLDAWKNGGAVDGKKVTDAAIIAYWQKRLSGISADDPLYDTYKNNVSQTEYTIAQQKQELRYTQGKITDAQFAKFYLDWSKKAPTDSQFYRTLQEDAARLLQAAKDRAASGQSNSKVSAYNAFTDALQKKDIFLGDALDKAYHNEATLLGYNPETQSDAILSALNRDIVGQPGAYQELLDGLKANHEAGTQITADFYGKALRTEQRAWGQIATRSLAEGYLSNYTSATDKEAAATRSAAEAGTWSTSEVYQAAQVAFDRTWNNPNASQDDKTAAASAFAEAITRLANKPGQDPNSRTALLNDVAALKGGEPQAGPSYGETHGIGVTGNTAKNIADWSSTMAVFNQTAKLAQTQPDSFVNGPMSIGADGLPHFDPKSQTFGVIARGELPPGSQAVPVPSATGASIVYLPVHDLTVHNPSGGPDVVIGKSITYFSGGVQTILVSHPAADGVDRWSPLSGSGVASPLASGATASVDANGNAVISLPPTASGASLTPAQSQAIAAMAPKIAADPSGSHSQAIDANTTLSYKNGAYSWDVADKTAGTTDSTPLGTGAGVWNPTTLKAAVFDTARVAHPLPGRDFYTPMGAGASSAELHFSGNELAALDNNAMYGRALMEQATQVARVPYNPSDPNAARAASLDPVVKGIVSETTQGLGSHLLQSLSRSPGQMDLRRLDMLHPFDRGEAANPSSVSGLSPTYKVPAIQIPSSPASIGATPRVAAPMTGIRGGGPVRELQVPGLIQPKPVAVNPIAAPAPAPLGTGWSVNSLGGLTVQSPSAPASRNQPRAL